VVRSWYTLFQDQLKAMGADVTVHSLTKEDLLVVIKEMESEVNKRKAAVRQLKIEAQTLREALAWNTAGEPPTPLAWCFGSNVSRHLATKIGRLSESVF
jgi:hypothetical protein